MIGLISTLVETRNETLLPVKLTSQYVHALVLEPEINLVSRVPSICTQGQSRSTYNVQQEANMPAEHQMP